MTNSKNMQDLIISVSRETELPEEKTAAAVNSTLRYLTARLPSPIVGQLHELLQLDHTDPSTDRPAPPAKE